MPSIAAQWWRVIVDDVRDVASSGGSFGLMQASEWIGRFSSVSLSWDPTATGTGVAGGAGGSWNSGGGEGADKLRDNFLTGKGLYAFGSTGVAEGAEFIIDAVVGAVTLDGYMWGMANDADARDPKSWRVYYSTTSSSGPWTLADTRTGITLTTSRDVESAEFLFPSAGGPVVAWLRA